MCIAACRFGTFKVGTHDHPRCWRDLNATGDFPFRNAAMLSLRSKYLRLPARNADLTRRGRDRSSSVSALPPVWSEAQVEAPASPSHHQVHEAHRHPLSCAQGAATSDASQGETLAPPMREDPIQFLTLDGAVPAILPLLVFSPCTPLGRCMDKTCGETRCSSSIEVDAANIRSNRLGRALSRFRRVEDCA